MVTADESYGLRRVMRVPVRRPWLTLWTLAVVTVAMGWFATQQDTTTDITEFAPVTPAAETLDEVGARFGGDGGPSTQVIVDAGAGGDVWSPEGVRVAEDLSRLVRGGVVTTWAEPILAQLDALGVRAEDADDQLLRLLADVADPSQAAGLLSDTEQRQAGIAVVDDDDAEAEDLEGVAERAAAGSTTVTVFSPEILAADVDEGFETELPALLAASLLVLLAVLAVMYRNISDVVVGVGGLAIAIVWMAGAAVLLGPDYAGLVGPFSQIAVAVPVLVVGLGIDYSVHLVTRYREEVLRGRGASGAAVRSLQRVGVALVLATIATVTGFLANAAAPLPPVADFGVFAALGVVASLVVLVGLVPAVRVLLDRRGRGPHRPVGDVAVVAAATSACARVATTRPRVVLSAAAAVLVVATIVSSGLGTSFSQEDFIPEESDAAVTLDLLDRRFGGDTTETTDVIVTWSGDHPQSWRDLDRFEQRAADVDGVEASDGRAATASPLSRASEVVSRAGDVTDAVTGSGAASTDDLVEQMLATLRVDQLPASLRGELADAVAERVPGEVASYETTSGVSAEKAVAGFLADVDVGHDGGHDVDEVARERAGMRALREAGAPVDELADEERELLRDADRLRDAGVSEDGVAPTVDARAVTRVLERRGDLIGVVDGDAALVSVATRGGEADARRIARELTEAAPEAWGARATSEQLVIDDTMRELADAQTDAIGTSLAAAGLLMVVVYGARRRPMLGVVSLLPALTSVPMVLATMRAAGLSMNAMTATIASIAIGIGVPYGIHFTNRYLAEAAARPTSEAVTTALSTTGVGMVGSAVTTAAAFLVLSASGFPPVAQFGAITAATIAYALASAMVVQPAAIAWWDGRKRGLP